MTFELYIPTHTPRMPAGTARLTAAGMLKVAIRDVQAVGLKQHAVVLVDRDHRIVALRPPHEAESVPTIGVGRNKTGTTAQMSIRGPLSLIDEPPGRKTVDLIIKDGMLMILFGVSVKKAKRGE